jgi:hypothetical protein
MLREEAQWLRDQLDLLGPADLSPMCNIGSSTAHFRRVEQPYIEECLFAPMRARDIEVVHVDTKTGQGIDLVGDLTDIGFLRRLTALRPRSIMCCNLLEHVLDRQIICDAMRSMVPPGGYLFLTVPHRFPYHEDPIDTMFRPTIAELAQLFPGTSIHAAGIVPARRGPIEMSGRRWPVQKMILRALAPFYRPRRWWSVARGLYQMATGYSVTCVLFRKDVADAAPATSGHVDLAVRNPEPELT